MPKLSDPGMSKGEPREQRVHGLHDIATAYNHTSDFDLEYGVGHLLRRVCARARANSMSLLKTLHVTPMQATAIRTLHRRGPLSQAELGRAIGMGTGNVHGLVMRLKKTFLVRFQGHPNDSRQVVVTLTVRGQELASQIANLNKRSSDMTLEGLSAQERAAFMDVLQRLAL